jgi:manganese-dependent ADP-ribose/CDP-alcohol diphosphatase
MKLLIAPIISSIILFYMPLKPDPGVVSSDTQSQKPLFSFGVIADVQYSDNDAAGTRFYRSSIPKLREAAKVFKEDSVSFILNLGDIIDRDYQSYKPVLDILDSSGIKTYHVAGNHDYAIDSRYKKHLPVLKSEKEGYYSFEKNNFRFIFLNGNELSTYFSENKASVKKAEDYITMLKNKGAVNALEWNGGINKVQLEWFVKELDKAASANKKVFIICHFPVAPENAHNLLNYPDILSILEKYNNIIAWFNGHNHAGNYGNFNMIHFVTFKGMVETEKNNSFSVIEVYNNKLWIRGYGREKSQILAI